MFRVDNKDITRTTLLKVVVNVYSSFYLAGTKCYLLLTTNIVITKCITFFQNFFILEGYSIFLVSCGSSAWALLCRYKLKARTLISGIFILNKVKRRYQFHKKIFKKPQFCYCVVFNIAKYTDQIAKENIIF